MSSAPIDCGRSAFRDRRCTRTGLPFGTRWTAARWNSKRLCRPTWQISSDGLAGGSRIAPEPERRNFSRYRHPCVRLASTQGVEVPQFCTQISWHPACGRGYRRGTVFTDAPEILDPGGESSDRRSTRTRNEDSRPEDPAAGDRRVSADHSPRQADDRARARARIRRHRDDRPARQFRLAKAADHFMTRPARA